ncbi:hypothetical protein HY229_06580 [Candidatus Acetothermia bacterium]|nr:hypothetical protein [Candidatus Acetothermia bacterium]MBI3643748.1 hypothetical protein [Candidatus Acetothermia bacterium]
MRNGSKFLILPAILLLVTAGLGFNTYAELFQMPGVIPPSSCRVGAVLSTDQFTTTGFSNVRTANPNDEIVAGDWVVANEYTPDTSVILAPNCTAPVGNAVDGQGLNVMALRLKPTISSAADADIKTVELVWDVNANGLWDPLLDLVLQTKPGSDLDTPAGAVYFNGAQSPIAFLSNTPGITPSAPIPARCAITAGDAVVVAGSSGHLGVGPASGTNSRPLAGGGTNNGCFIALLAIVTIGDSPKTGSQFGLSLEALGGDIPGTTGISSYTISNGFSSSRNPQGSNVRLDMIGGLPSSHTPLEHISNGSGSPESAVRPLTFTGGQKGEGLLSRFRALEIDPGTREAIAMVVGLCDGAELANTTAAILPAIAGAPPTIAGGLASLPCIKSAGTDGYATGINGATLIFRGPLARYMGTVRMYVDECSVFGAAAAPAGAGVCNVSGGNVAPTTATIQGGGDGFLFQAGELSEQATPSFNEQTGEAIVQFGGRQEQILYTGNGSVVAAGADPATPAIGGTTVGTRPLIILWTVDIDQNAPGGTVDVLLGFQTFDDTAINIASTVAGGQANPCIVFAATALTAPKQGVSGLTGGAGSCGSNFLNIGPETYSFSVAAPQHPSSPNSLAAFDTNKSCFLDDPEFFAMIDGWVANQIGDTLFFKGVDAWVGQTNVCNAPVAAGVNGLSLNGVSLETNSLGTTTFVANGQGIEGMNVEIYGLNGNVVFNQEVAGNHLSWNQVNTNGAPLANGTYLYVVKVKGTNGQTLSSVVKKLVVVR